LPLKRLLSAYPLHRGLRRAHNRALLAGPLSYGEIIMSAAAAARIDGSSWNLADGSSWNLVDGSSWNLLDGSTWN